MSIREKSYDVGIMLGALRVPFIIMNVIKSITTQYLIDDFGVVVSVINFNDFEIIDDKLNDVLKGYRKVYITDRDDVGNKRYEIIWALMESGYMRWLRLNYATIFPNILKEGGLSNLIIDERLRRWNNTPKYKYLIGENVEAKTANLNRLLSIDPGFFDYMPKLEVKNV
jgi:hypothetical protein